MSEQSKSAAGRSPYLAAGLGIGALFLLADLVSKWWVMKVFDLPSQGRINIFPHFDMVFVLNRGVSYGMFTQDSQSGQWFLIAFAMVAATALMFWLVKAESRLVALALGLIISGAIGNSIDRALYGGVVDFISLYAFDFYWYVFNIADVAIVAGVAGLIYDSIWPSRSGTDSN